jgi:2,4-dienoyl-CoA reductase-like NADH-dependent reductase (Old Yellow Enzyme family)
VHICPLLLNILIFEMFDVIQITDAVHAHGSFVFLQLWALGRATDAGILKRDDLSFDAVSPGRSRSQARKLFRNL